jgi:hypothetical protein
MARNYKIDHIIICDDVRREDNKKEIIIGMYPNGEIVFANLPAATPVLTFRLQFRFPEPLRANAQFQVRSPSKSLIFSVEMEIEAPAPPQILVLQIQRSPSTFVEDGDFDILLGIDDKPRKIGQFKVVDRSKSPPNS